MRRGILGTAASMVQRLWAAQILGSSHGIQLMLEMTALAPPGRTAMRFQILTTMAMVRVSAEQFCLAFDTSDH
jgi:hypothetical protein